MTSVRPPFDVVLNGFCWSCDVPVQVLVRHTVTAPDVAPWPLPCPMCDADVAFGWHLAPPTLPADPGTPLDDDVLRAAVSQALVQRQRWHRSMADTAGRVAVAVLHELTSPSPDKETPRD